MFACESSNGVAFFCATRFVRCPEEAVASNALTDMVNLTRADLGRIVEGYFVIDGAPMAIST
jgi:hypothetical protein